MKRRIPILLATIFVAVCAIYFYLRPDLLFPARTISGEVQNVLIALGDSAIASGDVPISAVILYGDRIVGEGYNTVVRNGNAAGHAEINAISSAIRQIGFESFEKLDRDSLELVSTYEPCPMCRDAIALYRIKRVQFLKEKSIRYRLEEEMSTLVYRFRERKAVPDSIQDYLFRRHPGFAKQKL
ncbi:MAG TPA: nucleoside deaminase [Candidatus Kryptonia bacterium]